MEAAEKAALESVKAAEQAKKRAEESRAAMENLLKANIIAKVNRPPGLAATPTPEVVGIGVLSETSPVEHNASISRAVEEAVREVYGKHDHEKLSNVLRKLKYQYAGNELALYHIVCRKYGLTPATLPKNDSVDSELMASAGPAAVVSRRLEEAVAATPCKPKQADLELTPEKVVDNGESCNTFALNGDDNDAAAQEGPAAVAAAVAGRPRGHDPEEESGTQICVLAELARKEEELDPAAQQCLEKLGPAKAAELLQKVVSKGGANSEPLEVRRPCSQIDTAEGGPLQRCSRCRG